ncbi:hypothetical protein LPU83_pLPU83d_1085 (plasmid) [Rhizobium favelukesii]|uniref:Transposase TnpC homeodomain domain-containing protein n=1 Tax=Rhizobium favelukesii TaxID=348824 RepID=W6RQN6_9HYPH|nr:hypothetical protein LPU83_pLPU83d_1085 [Rhizobium favelukesii]
MSPAKTGPAERRQFPMRAFPPEILAAAISTHEPHRMASKRPPSGTQTRCKHKKTSRLWTETKLEIEKLKRDIHGNRSERKARLLEQMELQLEELEADASQDQLAAEMAARSSTVKPLSASVHRANRFRSICRASALCFTACPPARRIGSTYPSNPRIGSVGQATPARRT